MMLRRPIETTALTRHVAKSWEDVTDSRRAQSICHGDVNETAQGSPEARVGDASRIREQLGFVGARICGNNTGDGRKQR